METWPRRIGDNVMIDPPVSERVGKQASDVRRLFITAYMYIYTIYINNM
jgi:hypothetical protein